MLVLWATVLSLEVRIELPADEYEYKPMEFPETRLLRIEPYATPLGSTPEYT